MSEREGVPAFAELRLTEDGMMGCWCGESKKEKPETGRWHIELNNGCSNNPSLPGAEVGAYLTEAGLPEAIDIIDFTL